jgi:membrane protein YdbS with pleckstrin-like domain
MLIVGVGLWIFALVIVTLVGYKQNEENDRWALMANIMFVVAATVVFLVVHDGFWFALNAFALAGVLAVHHGIIHRASDFSQEVTCCCRLQFKDICNHETWIVACVVAGSTAFLFSVEWV